MADYAGAVAAIKSKFTAAWAPLYPTADVGFVNGPAPKQKDADGEALNWVLFEIVHADRTIYASGTPGAQTVIYDGLIKAHIFVPKGSGADGGLAMAIAAGGIFKNQLFYDDGAGSFVRSGYQKNAQPRVDGGDVMADDGSWFSTTATIPFEFWTRE